MHSMESDEVLDHIKLYKRKLEKYVICENSEKIIFYIQKLKGLPVTTIHLRQTDIGRVVNRLSPCDGSVGVKADSLVQKWRDMANEEDKREQEAEAEKIRIQQEQEVLKFTKEHEEANSGLDIDSDDGFNLQIEENREADREESVIHQDKAEDDTDSQNGYNPHTSRQDYLNVGYSNSNYPSYSPSKSFSYEMSSPPPVYEPSNSNDDSKLVIDDKDDTRHRSHHKSKKKHKDEKDRKKEEKSSHKNHNTSKSKDEKHSRNKEKSKHREEKSKKREKEVANRKKDKIHSSDKDSSASKHSSSKDKERHRSKEHTLSKTKTESKEKEQKKFLMDVNLDFFGASESPKKKTKKEHSKSKSSHKVSQSASRIKSTPNDFESLPSQKQTYTSHLEINQSSDKKKRRESEANGVATVVAPEIACPLPSYKPLPKVPEKPHSKKGQSSNEEGLNFMFSSRKNRQRKMYTGNAVGLTANIPPLSDMCIKILLENLELMRGRNFDEIQPVLEKATPQQLEEVEYFDHHLMEDTGYMWESHCKKLFKAQKRQEMETWKDMFDRCQIEYQEKLENVTKNLQRKYVTKAEPKRTTQMAYVNPDQKKARSLGRMKVSTYQPSEPERHLVREDFPPSNAPSSASRFERSFPPKPQAKKTRMAPLMAKTLQLHKKVCRR